MMPVMDIVTYMMHVVIYVMPVMDIVIYIYIYVMYMVIRNFWT
jgi:hypothetical protein